MTHKDLLIAEVLADPADLDGVADTVSYELWLDGVSRGMQPTTRPQFDIGRLAKGTHTAYAVAIGTGGERLTGETTTFTVSGAPVKTRVEVKLTTVISA